MKTSLRYLCKRHSIAKKVFKLFLIYQFWVSKEYNSDLVFYTFQTEKRSKVLTKEIKQTRITMILKFF